MSSSGVFGTYQGTVVNNVDPLSQSRLILKVPQVLGEAYSNWAVPTVPAPTVPKVNDQVWVHFAGGDTNRPIWAAAKDGSIQVGDTTDGFFVLPTGLTAYHNGTVTLSVSSTGETIFGGTLKTAPNGPRVEITSGSFSMDVYGPSTFNPSTNALSGERFSGHIYQANYIGSNGTTVAPSLTIESGTISGSSFPAQIVLLGDDGTANKPSSIEMTCDGVIKLWGSMLDVSVAPIGGISVTINPTNTTTITGHDFLYNGAGQVNLTTNSNNQIVLSASGNMFFSSGLTTYLNAAGRQFIFQSSPSGDTNPWFAAGASGLKFISSGTTIQARNSGDSAYATLRCQNLEYAGSLTPISRREVKTDIKTAGIQALDEISKTPIYTFRMLRDPDNPDSGYDDHTRLGPILDEMPEILHAPSGWGYDQMNFNGLVWKAIQELAQMIKDKG